LLLGLGLARRFRLQPIRQEFPFASAKGCLHILCVFSQAIQGLLALCVQKVVWVVGKSLDYAAVFQSHNGSLRLIKQGFRQFSSEIVDFRYGNHGLAP